MAHANLAARSDRLDERSILVVDDDPSILDVMSMALELAGYSVRAAHNGAEALALVEEAMPSLVVLDMRMPVLDGWGFAQALQTRGLQVPILVVTAAQDARGWADQIHAEGYLAKPFEITELLRSVAQLYAVA
jgi:CheY-like chemotaxis protein